MREYTHTPFNHKRDTGSIGYVLSRDTENSDTLGINSKYNFIAPVQLTMLKECNYELPEI